MKTKLPIVSVIVANYNGKKYLKHCFNSLFKLNYPKNKLEIIMVDNCSGDKSIDYVRKYYPQVKIIENDVNNYCRANNLGIKQSKGRFVALLNNDTQADKNWLIELVKVIGKDSSIGAVGSKILFRDGRIESIGHQELLNFYWGDKGSGEKDSGQYEKLEEFNSLCGCAALYRRTALKEIGQFDEDFHMYYEDIDISMRLKQKNWRLVYVPKSLIYHKHHGTAQEDSPSFYTERNRLMFIAKYYPEKLSKALFGKGYFTAAQDSKAPTNLLEILDILILKLIKHHKIEIVKPILVELVAELNRISDYENRQLNDGITNLLKSVDSQQEIIQAKDKYLGSLKIEIDKRDQALQAKDTHLANLNTELAKRDQALKTKDEYLGSLKIEIDKRGQALQAKETHLANLNTELAKQDSALQAKDEYLHSLKLEIDKRDQVLQAKEVNLISLNTEIAKRDQALKTKDEYLDSLKIEIDKRGQALQAKDTHLANLNTELAKQIQALQAKEANLISLNTEIAKQVQALEAKDEYLNNLKIEIDKRGQALQAKDTHLANLNTKLAKQDSALQAKDEYLHSLKLEIDKRDQVLQAKEANLISLNTEIAKQVQALEAKDEYLHSLKLEIDKRDQAIEAKDIYLTHLNTEITKQVQALQAKDDYLHNLKIEIDQRDQGLKAKDTHLANLNTELAKRDQALQAKDEYIDSLQLKFYKKDEEIKGIYNSTAFRLLVRPLWTILWRMKQSIKRIGLLKLTSTEPQESEYKEEVVTSNTSINAVSNTGICTIISKNYLSYARVLAKSFLKYNKGRVFVLLTDKVDGYFDPKQENFTLIEIEALRDRIRDFDKFCFQYNITELNTAVKPFFLEFLFEKYKLSKLIFFDPDILITSDLEELFHLLAKYSIILIPHITRPFGDNHKPAELNILQSGVYNLGFIGLSYRHTTKNMLKWWQECLQRYCKSDVESGLFVDQKWIDLIPGFFNDVFILRDKRYNIAYWNYHYRRPYIDNSRVLIDNVPVNFLHFSGFEPENLISISRHQNRYTLKQLPHLKPIFKLYKDKLISNGYHESKNWPCIFNFFDNGVKIAGIARKIYWKMEDSVKEQFGNPYSTLKNNNYLNWLNTNLDVKFPPITNLMYAIYKERPDVQKTYPDLFNSDRETFINWFLLSVKREYDIEITFLRHSSLCNDWSRNKFLLFFPLKAVPKMRNIIKICLKKVCRNNIRQISKLKMAEMRFYQILTSPRKPFKKSTFYIRKINHKRGINLYGYLNAELGVGEGARANARSLKAAGIEFSLINIPPSYSRKCDSSFSQFSLDNPHNINLIHINADMLPSFYTEKGRDYFKNKYNIGFWTWELSGFPNEWLESFYYCNEIWVPSSFVQYNILKKAPAPVIRIPHAVSVDRFKDLNKAYFGLSDKDFIFLFVFDFLSFFERKNPLGVVNAFKQSFSSSENVKLVIKCINSSFDPLAMKKLKEAARGLNIGIIDKYLYRDEINTLISLCDCYISLHRSEGFGLTLAEAMYLGKPVIGTGYSGNCDFMNINNSYLVKYKLVGIERDVGPYRRGGVWAEPNIKHAAELMRYVYVNRKEAVEMGKIASAHIRRDLNYNKVGNEIKNRIDSILI